MTTSRPIRTEAALAALERAARSAELPAQDALEEIVRWIAAVIDFDGVFAGATDPDTGLCLGAGLVCDIDEQVCHPIWENEFLIPDVNKFTDLAAANPVGDLREATQGRPTRSARYRMMRDVTGLGEELRATFPAGGRCWGLVQLNREAGGPAFTADDRAFLRTVAPLAGATLRRSLLEVPPSDSADRGPGIVLLDESGTVISATAAAEDWLTRLLASWPVPATAQLPPAMVLGALSTLDPTHGGTWRARARTSDGRWVVARAAPLPDRGQVAMVIEPAQASEIAPVLMGAYGLTGRETEVTYSVARGRSTAEIAAAMSVSRHTVRDHLKAIFEKVGVSSRGELTSRLFAEQYHEHYDRALDGSRARMPAVLESARPVL